jgi:hypothetical protein
MTYPLHEKEHLKPPSSEDDLVEIFEALSYSAPEKTPATKTAEDYQLTLHDKLLEARKDATDFANVYMTTSYAILGIIVLMSTGYISKLSAVGADLNLNGTYAPEYIIILLILVYVILDFHMLRLSRIFRAIRQSGSRLKSLNTNAKVIAVEDMHLFVSGISGVIMALARAQTREMLSSVSAVSIKPFIEAAIQLNEKPTIKTFSKVMGKTILASIQISRTTARLGIRLVVATVLIYFPIIASVFSITAWKYAPIISHQPKTGVLWYYWQNIPIIDYAIVMMIIAVLIVTLYAGIVLAFGYSADLVGESIEKLGISSKEFAKMLSRLVPEQLSDDLQKQITEPVRQLQRWWEGQL